MMMTVHKFYLNVFLLLFTILLIPYSLFQQETQKPSKESNPFQAQIDQFILWDKKNSFPKDAILFVGSSSIRLWKSAEAFPNYPNINRGFGGSQISDVNYFYEDIVRKYEPKTIVFYCGDNDIAAGKSPDSVFNELKTFIGNLTRDMPNTHLFYLPIKPSISRWQYWPVMSKLNDRIRLNYSNNTSFTFVDAATPMLGNNAEPDSTLFRSDGLHLNENGYKLWNSILSPHLKELFSTDNLKAK